MCTATTQFVLVVFLLSNLIIALYFGRGIKKMKEYALANKSLGLIPLISNLFGTLLISSAIGIGTASYEGIISLIFPLFLAITSFILGWFVFPNMTRLNKEYTLASIMNKLYGPFARSITIILSSTFSLLIICNQLKALGEISFLFSLNKETFLLTLGFIVTFYVAFGGMRSVTAANIFQFGLVIVFFILFFLLTLHPEGINHVLNQLPQESNYLKFWDHPKILKRIPVAMAWSVFPSLIISPPIIQQLCMTTKKKAIRTTFTSFSILYMLVRLLTLVLGIKLFILNGNKYQEMPLGNIISKLSSRGSIAQVAFSLGICAVLMSTMASFLHSTATMWNNDLVKPLMNLSKKNYDDILCTKLITLFIGVSFTLLAIFWDFNLYEIEGYACILLSSISIPFIGGLIGFKTTTKVFKMTLIAFLTSLILPVILYYYSNIEFFQQFLNNLYAILFRIDKKNALIERGVFRNMEVTWIILAMPISICIFLISHYLDRKRVLADQEK